MKNVECLLSGIKVVERKGAVVTEVSGVESDSRQVKKDNLFVAVRGASVDGHDFIGQAIAQGAVVVVCEEFPEKSEPQVSYVKVEDSAVAFGWQRHGMEILRKSWYWWGSPVRTGRRLQRHCCMKCSVCSGTRSVFYLPFAII